MRKRSSVTRRTGRSSSSPSAAPIDELAGGHLDEPRQQLFTHRRWPSVYSRPCGSSRSRWSASSRTGSTGSGSTCRRAACIRSACASWSATARPSRRCSTQPLIYTQTNGTEALRDGHRRALPRRDRRPRAGDQRRVGSQLRRHLAAGAAGRRGGGAGAHLHADAGLVRAFGGVVREWPLVRGPRGRTLARPTSTASPRSSDRGRARSCICTPNNPTGARLTAAELDAVAAVADRIGCWVRVRRDLSRRRARRRRVAVDVGPRRARHRDERTVEGLRPAGAAGGLGRVGPPSVADVALGAITTTRRSRPGALSDRLATVALAPPTRGAAARAARAAILRENLPRVEAWLRDCGHRFEWIRARGRRLRLHALRATRSTRPRSSTRLRERRKRAGRARRRVRDGRLPALRRRRTRRLRAGRPRAGPRRPRSAAAGRRGAVRAR